MSPFEWANSRKLLQIRQIVVIVKNYVAFNKFWFNKCKYWTSSLSSTRSFSLHRTLCSKREPV